MSTENHPLQHKITFIILLLSLGALFLVLLRPVLMPIILAGIIALLFFPLYKKLNHFLKNKPHLSAFICTVAILLFLGLPFGLLLALLVNQALDFFANQNGDQLQHLFASKELYINHIQPWVTKIELWSGLHLDLQSILTNWAREIAHNLYQFSPQVLTGTAGFIFLFITMHIALYFLFVEGPSLVRVIMDLSPIKVAYEEKLVTEFKNTIEATIYGYVLTAFIQALLAAGGFWLAGVNSPLVFGLLTFIFSMVPLVGATIVWLPVGIYYLLIGSTGWAIFIFIYGALVISGIDNIIKPLIIQGKSRIHPVLIFFSLMGGLKLFGPIGILFGPVITSLFSACIRIYREDFLIKE